MATYLVNDFKFGKISAKPHTTLCIQFLNRENNDKNSKISIGKTALFTTAWDNPKYLPKLIPSLAVSAFIYI